jgi:hypothetical protein
MRAFSGTAALLAMKNICDPMQPDNMPGPQGIYGS